MLLGVDVGGTKIALALADEAGVIRARERWPTPGADAAGAGGEAQRALSEVAARARALAAGAGVAWEEIGAAGVSLPGPLDRAAGVLLDPPNLPGSWHGAPVRALLAEALQMPAAQIALENDANAAALAEWRFGAGRGLRDVVYLTMSTGVGGGLVLSGELHRGLLESAGEIGHAPVEWQGAACACGMRGCLEAYVGGAAWTRRLAQITPPESRAAQLAGAVQKVRPEHLVAAAGEGDGFALAEMARYNDYLARGIIALAYTLAPEMVILGTIPSAAGAALCLDPVRAMVRARIWPFLADRMRIELSGCGKDLPELAGIAAAMQAIDSRAG